MYGPVEADFRRRLDDRYAGRRKKSLAFIQMHVIICRAVTRGQLHILIRFLTILKRVKGIYLRRGWQ